jgi:tetratricopeptide (TPR) repeat protein
LAKAAAAWSDDVVSYRHPDTGALTRVTGEILQYTAAELRIRPAAGREAVIPAERVQRVESAWTAAHAEADQLFEQARFGDALRHYGIAFGQEKRSWIRHRILAQTAWCYRSLGELDGAADAFLRMVRDNPDTPYFDAIPLVWQPYLPPTALEERATSWIENNSPPLVALTASSWLLSGRKGPTARQALRRLASGSDPPVAMMARAQLWRVQIVTATADDLKQWEATIDQMPAALRAGPYFVLGQALAHRQQPDAAVLALLRVPILYPREYNLAAESLLVAGQLREQQSSAQDARRLYGEIAQNYPDSASAALAEQYLRRLVPAAPE